MTERRTISVETARAAVLASGDLESLDGPYFLAAEDAEWKRVHFGTTPPIAARVVITRRGHAPREVIIGWDEYEAQDQTDPDWNATRALKPMTIFGSEVERHAYRVTFADILAPLLTAAPAVADDGPAPWETADAVRKRDWAAEIAAAADVDALDAVVREARAVRVFKPTPEGTALDRAWKARRRVLAEAAPVVEDAWAEATPPRSSAPEADAEAPRAPAAPRDHLPPAGNRAARRAQKRKGARRGR